jgi:hypothetical protein
MSSVGGFSMRTRQKLTWSSRLMVMFHSLCRIDPAAVAGVDIPPFVMAAAPDNALGPPRRTPSDGIGSEFSLGWTLLTDGTSCPIV